MDITVDSTIEQSSAVESRISTRDEGAISPSGTCRTVAAEVVVQKLTGAHGSTVLWAAWKWTGSFGIVWGKYELFGIVWDCLGMEWFGIVWDPVWDCLGLACIVWDGLGWLGMVWDGWGWFGLVWAIEGWRGAGGGVVWDGLGLVWMVWARLKLFGPVRPAMGAT
jgi:hypothetical protein